MDYQQEIEAYKEKTCATQDHPCNIVFSDTRPCCEKEANQCGIKDQGRLKHRVDYKVPVESQMFVRPLTALSEKKSQEG